MDRLEGHFPMESFQNLHRISATHHQPTTDGSQSPVQSFGTGCPELESGRIETLCQGILGFLDEQGDDSVMLRAGHQGPVVVKPKIPLEPDHRDRATGYSGSRCWSFLVHPLIIHHPKLHFNRLSSGRS
jgi:hypothetical protein